MTITRFISRIVLVGIAVFATALSGATAASAAPTPSSIGQCTSGYFCIWSAADYGGSFQQFSATSSYRQIALSSVNSLYNRRSDRTYLYEGSNGTGSLSCYGPGAKVANLSGWRETARSVWLSTVTNC